jgi:hypothetical protein
MYALLTWGCLALLLSKLYGRWSHDRQLVIFEEKEAFKILQQTSLMKRALSEFINAGSFTWQQI